MWGCGTEHEAVSFDIKPVPPSLTTGTGRARLNGQGDLILEISVRGPSEEISKPGSQDGNLLWHLLEGDCAAWQRNERGHKVMAR